MVERDAVDELATSDIDRALDDMLFGGGQLNVRLLGGAVEGAAG